MAYLIDSHCHLDRIDLTDFAGSLAGALAAAKTLEVEKMICVSVDWETFPAVLNIAEQFESVFASVGVHPTEFEGVEPTEAMLVQAASHPKVVAIGETGLDYYRLKEETEKNLQQQRFRVHIRAAKKSGKPLIIHTRQACDDTIAILREEQAGPGVFHCFTEDYEMARRGLELGMYISFSGIITFKNAETLRDVVKQIPLDRILVETDAPYLTPAPYRGKPNQPGYTRFVAEQVAALHGISYPELRNITTQNCHRLFTFLAK